MMTTGRMGELVPSAAAVRPLLRGYFYMAFGRVGFMLVWFPRTSDMAGTGRDSAGFLGIDTLSDYEARYRYNAMS